MDNSEDESKPKQIILLDGSPATSAHQEDTTTERSVERDREDRDYIPVIVKRNDQGARHPDDTLANAVEDGLEQIERPAFSVFLSAVAAGLILGFAAMLVSFSTYLLPSDANQYIARLISAAFYPLGFIVCVMSGSQLFTEHTAMAVYPVLERKASLVRLARLWILIILGNFTGTFLVSHLLVSADQVIQVGAGYVKIAEHMFHTSNKSLFYSALLAGWLMAQGAWLVLSTRTNLAQIVCIYIVTFTIGVGGLHHSIAGSAELFAAYLVSDDVSLVSICRFLAVAIFGNAVGGSVFVAVLNYAHIRQTQLRV